MIDKIKEYQTLIFLVALFAAGWGSHALYSNAITEAITTARKEAALSAAQEIAKIEITNTTIQQKIIERVSTKVQYRECRHDAETYADINKAFGDKK